MKKIILTLLLFSLFYAVKGQSMAGYEYWFDHQSEERIKVNSSSGNITLDIDVSVFAEGIHFFNFRAKDSNGQWSAPVTQYFLHAKLNPTNNQLTQYEYWIDRDFANRQAVVTSNGIINLNIDLSAFAEGIRYFNFRAKDSDGKWSAPVTQYFLCARPNSTDNQLAQYEYWIDRDFATHQEIVSANGVVNLNVDVASLNKGIHYFNFRAKDSNGSWSTPVTQYFYIPENVFVDNKIVAYEYWCNQSDSAKKRVDIAPVNPLELQNQLLDVGNLQPKVTPDNFEFVTDVYGNAKIYYLGGNQFTIRFLDETGRWSAPSVSLFADGKGVDVVADTIYSNVPVTRTKPRADQIHFYKLNALKGDSLIWKTNQPCSLQVFDPFGVEVYRADGDETLTFDGVRTKRDGVYYVLLHSVNSYTQQITLDYKHIHRYAVLGYDVKKVGNQGVSTINFEGNGFEGSTKVMFENVGHIIHPDTTICGDLGRLSTVVDFTGRAVGVYDVKVVFADTAVVIKNGLEVEEFNPIELDVSVIGPSNFRAGAPTTYTITVKNKGNISAYGVPLSLYIGSEGKNTISNLVFGADFPVSKVPDVNLDNYPKDIADSIRYWYAKKPDIDRFLKLYDSEADILSHSNTFLIKEIAASSMLSFTISITANSALSINASVPKQWKEGVEVHRRNAKGMSKISAASIDECCIISGVECIADLIFMYPAVKKAMDALPINKSCVTSIIKNTISFSLGVYCSDEPLNMDAEKGWNMVDLVSSSLLSCLEIPEGDNLIKELLRQQLKELVDFTDHLGDLKSLWNCGVVVHDLVTGECDKEKDKDEIKPTPIQSYDPNDKLGYRSPSGSTYFKEDVMNMTYVIRFENDPEKATAAAQDVYVTDTLDLSKFDISSFRAGYVHVGNKIKQAAYDTQEHSWDIDMRPEMNLITRVNLSLDKEKGIARWHFASIDPKTDEPVTDVFAGFLPPNDETGRGDGSVSFTINLKDNLPNDVEVTNRAKIVFDYNEPIFTPDWTNRKDVIPPVSSMLQPVELNDSVINLSWKGADNGSGVWHYNIYARSGDNENWYLAYSGIERTEGEFQYEPGVRYSFYAEATDRAGNREMKNVLSEVTFYKESSGTKDVSASKPVVYPNPTNGILYVENAAGGEIQIYDILGNLLIVTRENKIDVSEYPNGIYLLHIHDEIVKIVKQ